MISQSTRYASYLGIAGSLAIAMAPPAQSQTSDFTQITGGKASFVGNEIFVPDPNDIDSRAVVIGPNNSGVTIRDVQITTDKGAIPGSILFIPTVSPTLDTCPCGTPASGDTGNVAGTLSFVTFTSAGTPTIFNQVPAELSFTINSLTPTGSSILSTQYRTPPDYVVTTSGGVITDDSFTPTASAINVFVFQVQPQSSGPVSFPGIPASDFSDSIDGTTYPADFDVDLTGDFITTPNIVSSSGDSSSSDSSASDSASESDPASNFIPLFRVYRNPGPTTSYVAIGPTSRVFPGLVGVRVVAVNDDTTDEREEETTDPTRERTTDEREEETTDPTRERTTDEREEDIRVPTAR